MIVCEKHGFTASSQDICGGVSCPLCDREVKAGMRPEPPCGGAIPTAGKPGNKYIKRIKPINPAVSEVIEIDIYAVLQAYNVTNQALAHAIKKLLMPGERGGKGYQQDLSEAIQAIERAKEMGE